MKKYFLQFAVISIFIMVTVVGFKNISFVQAQAGTTPLSGYLWSSNIGWIGMSGVGVGPLVNNMRAISGHAWSPHIGWIKFGGLSGFPTGGGTLATDARINLSNGNRLEGWARACAGMMDPVNCTDAAPITVTTSTSGGSQGTADIWSWGSIGAYSDGLSYMQHLSVGSTELIRGVYFGMPMDAGPNEVAANIVRLINQGKTAADLVDYAPGTTVHGFAAAVDGRKVTIKTRDNTAIHNGKSVTWYSAGTGQVNSVILNGVVSPSSPTVFPVMNGGALPTAIIPTSVTFDYTTASNGQTSTNGQYQWTVPAGVTSVDVKVWGGGGGGAYSRAVMQQNMGSGGGGGELVVGTIPVSTSASYTIIIGGGGSGGGNGGDSSFALSSSDIRLGAGGGKGAGVGAGGGTLGIVQGISGFTRHSGGNGGTAWAGCGGGGAGGGGTGGGSWGYAGLYCNGQNGSGLATLGGGPGATFGSLGDGRNTPVSAYPNGIPGGGGSAGGVVDYTGYYMAPTPGAHGRIVITYTPQVSVVTPPAIDPRGGWDGWISLSGTGYGPTGSTDSSGLTSFSGFSWGSDVIGWVDWNGITSSVLLPGSAITLSNINPPTTANSITRITPGQKATLYWKTENIPQGVTLQPTLNDVSNNTFWTVNPSISNSVSSKEFVGLPVGTYPFALKYLKPDGSGEYVSSNIATIIVDNPVVPGFNLSADELSMKKYKDRKSNIADIRVLPFDGFASLVTFSAPIITNRVVGGQAPGCGTKIYCHLIKLVSNSPFTGSDDPAKIQLTVLEPLVKGNYILTLTATGINVTTGVPLVKTIAIPLTVTGDSGSFEEF